MVDFGDFIAIEGVQVLNERAARLSLRDFGKSARGNTNGMRPGMRRVAELPSFSGLLSLAAGDANLRTAMTAKRLTCLRQGANEQVGNDPTVDVR